MPQRKNEALLKRLCDECGGVFGTMAEAIEELDTPRIKPVRPFKAYDGKLTLGDPENYPDGSLTIWVERYFKTKEAKPQTGSVVVTRAETGPSQSTHTMDDADAGGGDFAAVKNARTYKVNDPDAPGGKRDVDFASLAKGYEYGRTAVHISESDFNITKFETERSFTIIGFIEWETVSKQLRPIHSPRGRVNNSQVSTLP
jgi:ATP-dependent DNA helicase 2 subunit 2